MNPAASRAPAFTSMEFADGLGVRSLVAEKAGETLEQLRLNPEFSTHSTFEFALRERVGRLSNFRHGYYARVRRVDRLSNGALGVVSEHTTGARLSHVLEVAERHRIELDINAALCLIRQLVPAIAMLHENARDVAHGALAPERIVVTPHARIVIAEYVLGSAIEQLALSRERLWQELRIAVPHSAGAPRFDHRTDVTQIGAVSLALVLGRPLRKDELRGLPELVAGATETTVLGNRELISSALRRWLMRALQLDPRGSFESAADAQQGLDEVLSDEGGYIAAPIALETFLAQYQAKAALPPPAERAAETQPAPASARPARARPVLSREEPAQARGGITSEPPALLARASEADLPARPGVPELQPMADAPQAGQAPPAQARSGRHRVAQVASSPGTAASSKATQPAAADPVAPAADLGSPHAGAATSRGVPAPSGLDRWIRPTEDAPSEDSVIAQPRRRGAGRWERVALVACLVVAIAQGAFIWSRHWSGVRVLPVSTGTVAIDSRPSGMQVVIDGEARGATPLTVELREGAHVLELRGGPSPRVLPINVVAGTRHAQYVELPSTQMTGTIQVRADMAGRRVLVDGRLRGIAPLTVADLEAGTHEVVVESRGRRVRQLVVVQPGVTAAFSPTGGAGAANGSTSGWVAIKTPYEMQVMENGRVLGTTFAERLALSEGRHELEVVSDTLQFRTRVVADVVAGRVAQVAVDLPKGMVSLTATPSAEVWIDGTKVGETPIVNLPVTIGPHEVTFKHPELGEQYHAISVTAAAPVRLSVEMKP